MRGKMNLNMEDLGMVAGGRMGHRSSASIKAFLESTYCNGKESEGKHDFKLIVHSDDLELFGIPNSPDVHRCKKCGYEKVIELIKYSDMVTT